MASGGGTSKKATPATRKSAPSKKAVAAAKPRLLSGGNPQIQKGDGDGPVQAYIAALPEWKRAVGANLDAIIARAIPGVRKAVKWNSPFYGANDGWLVSFHCFTNYLKVTFFNGATLSPPPPGRSKHENVRYLDIRENDAIDEKRLTKWLRQAAKSPGWKI